MTYYHQSQTPSCRHIQLKPRVTSRASVDTIFCTNKQQVGRLSYSKSCPENLPMMIFPGDLHVRHELLSLGEYGQCHPERFLHLININIVIQRDVLICLVKIKDLLASSVKLRCSSFTMFLSVTGPSNRIFSMRLTAKRCVGDCPMLLTISVFVVPCLE